MSSTSFVTLLKLPDCPSSYQAFFVKEYILSHPEDGEKIARLRELMLEQVRGAEAHHLLPLPCTYVLAYMVFSGLAKKFVHVVP